MWLYWYLSGCWCFAKNRFRTSVKNRFLCDRRCNWHKDKWSELSHKRITSKLNQVNISSKISNFKGYILKTYQVICCLCIYYGTIIIEHVRPDSLAKFHDITFPKAEPHKALESRGQKQQIPHPKNIFEYTAVMVIKRCIKTTLRLSKVYILV